MNKSHATRRFKAGRLTTLCLMGGGALVAALAIVAHLLPVPPIGLFLAAQAFWLVLLAAAVFLVLIGLIIALLAKGMKLAITSAVLVVAMAACLVVASATRSGEEQPSVVTTSGELRILSWNTNQQDVSVQQIQQLMTDLRPNVIVLPEYFPQVATGTLDSFADKNEMQLLGSENSAASLLVSKKLGKYRIVDADGTPAWAGFLAKSSDQAAPSLLVAHLQRPSVASASTWASHLSWVRDTCAADRNLIAVGDFNATNANFKSAGSLDCADAAATLGINSTGTWPSLLPARFGAAIDHVLTSGGWKARSYAVIGGSDAGGSDHRPIFVTADQQP